MEALIRSAPDGVAWRLVAVRTASSICLRAGETAATNCSPASVSETLRRVRLNSRTPILRSSAETAWLNAEGDIPRSSAAARKLRCRATASTAASSANPGFIVRFPAARHLELDRLCRQSGSAMCVERKESGMRKIERAYVGGKLVVPHGTELFHLFNPSEEEIIGQVRLADEQDARAAIAAAKAAQAPLSRMSKAERIDMLRQLHAEIERRQEAIMRASMLEYGAPAKRAEAAARHAAQSLADAVKILESYEFERKAGTADVVMRPIGVAGLITPWNSNAGFICSKVAYALAAGCASIVKPSEMSAFQTDVVIDAFLAAELPPGVVNILTGRGETVGTVLASHPDVAKISFTGSTAVGKQILRMGAETCKRVTLELGGKSPTIILDDADLEKTIPMAMPVGFINSGQACLAGTRILVPRSIQSAAEELIRRTVEATKVGLPDDRDAVIGPMVSEKQWERVQRYIRSGVAAGARVLIGGEGRPQHLPRGRVL